MINDEQVFERIRGMSRQAKRFMGAEPSFDASLEYESDVDGLVTTHPNWVASDNDLTPLGLKVRRVLQANPELIEEPRT